MTTAKPPTWPASPLPRRLRRGRTGSGFAASLRAMSNNTAGFGPTVAPSPASHRRCERRTDPRCPRRAACDASCDRRVHAVARPASGLLAADRPSFNAGIASSIRSRNTWCIVTKPAHRLLEGVLLRAARQRDTPRGEKVGDSVKARPVVDVPSIIVTGEESRPRSRSPVRTDDRLVESRLPGRRLDRRHVGDGRVNWWKITASW